MKYPNQDPDTPQVEESAVAYGQRTVSTSAFHGASKQVTIEEKIEYLRTHLPEDSFKRLEANNFFINQPFPSHEVNENWIDEAEATSEEDAIPDYIVEQHMETWKHVI